MSFEILFPRFPLCACIHDLVFMAAARQPPAPHVMLRRRASAISGQLAATRHHGTCGVRYPHLCNNRPTDRDADRLLSPAASPQSQLGLPLLSAVDKSVESRKNGTTPPHIAHTPRGTLQCAYWVTGDSSALLTCRNRAQPWLQP